MDGKIKELIAIGASFAAHCQSCLEYHVKEAESSGASSEEIKMAISIGKAVEKGASKKIDDFVKEIVGSEVKPQNDICCVDDSACCS